MRQGLSTNPLDFTTHEERSQYGSLRADVRAAQIQAEIQQGTWHSPAESPDARASTRKIPSCTPPSTSSTPAPASPTSPMPSATFGTATGEISAPATPNDGGSAAGRHTAAACATPPTAPPNAREAGPASSRAAPACPLLPSLAPPSPPAWASTPRRSASGSSIPQFPVPKICAAESCISSVAGPGRTSRPPIPLLDAGSKSSRRGGRPAPPLTPPDVRVRIRRFGKRQVPFGPLALVACLCRELLGPLVESWRLHHLRSTSSTPYPGKSAFYARSTNVQPQARLPFGPSR